MIVQALHSLQEECGGYLPADRLIQLSDDLGVPLYKLQAIASFFTHYRETPPPRVHIQVCRDISCHMRGSESMIDSLKELETEFGPNQVTVEGKSCLGRCDGAVATLINHRPVSNRSAAEIKEMVHRVAQGGQIMSDLPNHSIPETWNIDPYKGKPEYETVKRLVQSDDIQAEGEIILRTLEDAGLVGKGGPGARTAKKWRTVIAERRDKKFVVCNADESEPGTFKDRELLSRVPHLVIEGVMVAGLIIGAEKCYIYVRHEYPDQISTLRRAIEEAKEMRLCGERILGTEHTCDVEVFVSPGNYICGEQTALIQAMEDKRAEPRQRPPDLEIHGLHGYPTLVNNVETLGWVPSISKKGADWYKGLGANGCEGMRFTSISGDVNRPGVYEVPLGTTIGELLELVGGMKDGDTFQAFAPSGPSGGFLPRQIPRQLLPPKFCEKHIPAGQEAFDLFDLKMDNNFLRYELGGSLMMGAAHLFIGKRTNLLSLAKNCTEFFRNESCGQCVPCRIGSQKMVDMVTDVVAGKPTYTLETYNDLRNAMVSTSICGLGQVASNPLGAIATYFPNLLPASMRS